MVRYDYWQGIRYCIVEFWNRIQKFLFSCSAIPIKKQYAPLPSL